MVQIIHWSDTFPAFFPNIIANAAKNRKKKHIICHIDSVDNILEKKSDIHIVHGARNLEKIRTKFRKSKIYLFVHGMPDSLNEKKLNQIIFNNNPKRILVSTPDLLYIKNSKLFPYIPIDILKHNFPDQVYLKKRISNFSSWKGDIFNWLCYFSFRGYLNNKTYIFFVKKILLVMIYFKKFFLKFDKKISFSPKQDYYFERRHFKNRASFLNDLVSSKMIFDSDFIDFPNGGNLSITAIQAIFLNIKVISFISKKNLDIIKKNINIKTEDIHQLSNLDDAIKFFQKIEINKIQKKKNIFKPNPRLIIKCFKKTWIKNFPELF